LNSASLSIKDYQIQDKEEALNHSSEKLAFAAFPNAYDHHWRTFLRECAMFIVGF